MANHTYPTLGADTSSCPDCGALKCLCRPRFFAGQLLSEEDLNRLDRYIIEKQRLHNRFLHGWGVACGLEVTCDPCDHRLVKVSPGYALDPCGADIVVCREDNVPVCKLIDDCRRAERTRAPCGPYDAASSCPQAEETWVLAIRFKETPARGISALRRSADRCDPAQAGTLPPRGAPPQCEPRILCEDHVYEVYRAPEGTPNEEWDWGALMARAGTCFQGFFSHFPQAPEAVTTELQEPSGPDYLLVESVQGIEAGSILRIEPGSDNEEATTVDHVSSHHVHLTAPLHGAHGTGADIEVIDPTALSRLCCRVIEHFRRFLESRPGTDCRLLEQLGCVVCPDPRLPAQQFLLAWDRNLAQLSVTLRHLVDDCLCSALLPPCPTPSDGERVPLATVTVSPGECQVLRVCNWTAERKLLVSFPNLRYWLSWLPFGHQLREQLGAMCCGLSAEQIGFQQPAGRVVRIDPVNNAVLNANAAPGDAAEAATWTGRVRFVADRDDFVSVLLGAVLGDPIASREVLDGLMGATGRPPMSPEALDRLTRALVLQGPVGPVAREISPLLAAFGDATGATSGEIERLNRQVAGLEERLRRLEGADG